MQSETGQLTVRDLRRRWKPHKESLQAVQEHHPTTVRLHRAFSWLARVEGVGAAGSDNDVTLVCQWIALNALYGRWDPPKREPAPDQATWRAFLKRVLDLDAGGMLAQVLQNHKPLVLSILEDEYLSDLFWEEPTRVRAGRARRVMFDARTWYIEGRWGMILDRVVDRIYLLRCQLTHGAATYGGSLNRRSLKHCATMLGHLMPAVILVVIDQGRDDDWGPMCYPPMRPSAVRG